MVIKRGDSAAEKRAAAQAANDRAIVAALQAQKRKANGEGTSWHAGYTGPIGANNDIYFRYPTRSCREFADNGCWHVEVVTTGGCEYLEVSVNEMQGGAVVGGMIANQLNVPAHTPAILELDADKSNVTGGPVSFTCNNY